MPGFPALRSFLQSPAAVEEAPVDGIWLLQQYIKAERPVITRVEFTGGRFLYAVEVDTSAGFLLCPADECQTAVGDANCPVGESTPPTAAASAPVPSKFTVLQEPLEADLIERLERCLAMAGVDVCGVEFIRDEQGQAYCYDLNTNTNHNDAAEEKAGRAGTERSGPGALAKFLQAELAAITASKV